MRLAETPDRTMPAALPLGLKVYRAYLRSSLPGRTRLAAGVATLLPPLQRVPLEIMPEQRVFLDMRDVMARDLLAAYPPERPLWEPDEQQVMRRAVRHGDVVFDIGAHFGEHAVLLAELVGPRGRVIAFEPNPERIATLRRTVAQRGNGEVVAVALSDRDGDAELYVPELHAMASLADWTGGRGGPVRVHRCRTERLDTLVRNGDVPRPDFIKCDVEGAELAVFRGAHATLDCEDAPLILFEANEAAARSFQLPVFAAADFLVSLPAPRYALFWVQPDAELVPIRARVEGVHLFNLLAVPGVRIDRVLF